MVGSIGASIAGSVASSALSGIMGGDQAGASTQSAGIQSAAADKALALQGQIYNQNRSDLAPYRNIGGSALSQLGYLFGLQGYNPGGDYSALSSNANKGSSNNTISTYTDINGDALGSGDNLNIAPGTLAMGAVDMAKLRAAYQASPGSHRGTDSDRDVYDWYVKGSGTGAIDPSQFSMASSSDSNVDPNSYVNTGMGGYGSLSRAFGQQDLTDDDGYQFRLDQGSKALERSAAARGTLLSGAGLKAVQDYGQNAASQEYMNAYNRYNNNQTNLFNRLSSLSGTGLQATNSTVGAAENYGTNAADLLTSQGAANAAGVVGAANANNSGLLGAGNAFTTGLNSLGGIQWNSGGSTLANSGNLAGLSNMNVTF